MSATGTTARECIVDAFTAIQVYSPGEPLQGSDLGRGFETLNDMLESWSNESLTTYALILQGLTMIPGQYKYTIGVGAELDMTRPIRIPEGFGTAFVLDNTGNRYPLEIIQEDRWNQIGNIAQVNANIPLYLWYNPQYPWGIIHLYPIPTVSFQVFFNSYLQFERFDDINVNVFLPPGYVLAIKRNLALELAPYYPTAVVSQRLDESARIAKGNVKRSNFKPVVAQYDGELVAKAKATFNIYRDTGG